MALFNRKDKEDKKHKGENIVGKIIYIFLLFAPLFSILTTSLYTIFNKNAYESYYGETINEFKDVQPTELNNGQIYNLSIKASAIENNCTIYVYDNISDLILPGYSSTQIEDVINNTSQFLYLNNGTSNMYLSFRDSSNATILNVNVSTTTVIFNFTLNRYTGNISSIINYITTREYNNYSFLDNSFDYGIYKTEQNNLYNWAKDTGTYTIMKTTTDGLEINNTFIPMLLTYWLIISVIYFIYDIALMLIWILHRKIHELTESV